MTLSISVALPRAVIQVTDRLVSNVETMKTFDSISNKNVVLRARDGVVSIAYSGPAYLEGIPTDEWIAEALSGEILGVEGKRPVAKMGPTKTWLRVGHAVQTIAEAMQPLLPAQKPSYVQLNIAGWCWKTSGAEERLDKAHHVLWDVKVTQDRVDVNRNAKWEMRDPKKWGTYWMSVLGCSLPMPPHRVMWAPDGNLSEDEASALDRQLIGCTFNPRVATNLVVNTLRRKAQPKKSGIGESCLCIVLPHPENRIIQTRFDALRDDAHLAIDGERIDEIGFSPFVVGGNAIVYPSAVYGQAGYEFDGFRVEINGRPRTKRGPLLSGQFGQPRPPDPGHRRRE